MGPLRPLTPDAKEAEGKADKKREGQHRQHEHEVRQVWRHLEVISAVDRGRADPHKVVDVPNATPTEREQLQNPISCVAQIELVCPEHAEKER